MLTGSKVEVFRLLPGNVSDYENLDAEKCEMRGPVEAGHAQT